MTEGPGTTGAPGAEPAPADPAAAPRAPQAGSKRPVIIVVALVVFIGVVLFLVRDNVAADDLKVGDCFNVPNGTTVQTVEKRPCNESHTAQVIFAGDYDGDSYPISLSLERYIGEKCIPAYEEYLGRDLDSEPQLSVGYFHPTRDGWDGGDRKVTCYITQPDDSPMTESLRQ